MRRIIAILMLASVGAFADQPASPPSIKPGSTPATKAAKAPPKQKFSLMNGAVKFLVPDGWTESDRSDDEKNAHYHSPDQTATIFVGVVPQEYPLPQHNDAFREKMKTSIITAMATSFKDRGLEVLYGPKSETDDRFFIRLHDRVKEGDATLDEVHLYRAAGLDLLMVTTVVKTDSPDVAKPFHTIGEDTSLGMIVGRAEKKK